MNISRHVPTTGECAKPKAAAKGSPTTGVHTSSPQSAP